MTLTERIVVTSLALVTALAVPVVAAHWLGLSLFTSRALGIVSAMLLMYPVVVTKRNGRSLLAWVGAAGVMTALAFTLGRLLL